MKRLSLPVALVCGLMAALAVFLFLKDQERKALGPPPPKVPVVVAKNDIPANAKLTQDMVVTQEVLAETRHPLAAQTLDEVVGKQTLYPVVKGEQMLIPRLGERPKATTLAGVVPAGKRAISLAATDVIGVGGLIQTGDRVDVLAVFENKDNNKAINIATIVIENIEVLAVAKDVGGVEPKETNPADLAAKKNPSAVNPNATSTITVAVTPEDAQKLLLADRTGNMRLALRASGDSNIAATATTDTQGFLRVKAQ
jgi:pilus assembly protein CpaB